MRMLRRAITTLSFSAMRLGLAFAAYAGRVDEHILHAVADHPFVHRVAGGSGDGRNDGALLAGERVEQRRFAHVGAADDGHFDAGFRRRLFGRFGRRNLP